MVDSPYYRPPEQGDAGDTPVDPPGFGVAPVAFDSTPGPLGSTVAPGAAPELDGSVEPVVEVEDEPVEEIWQVVATIDEPSRTDAMAEEIQSAGFETWIRAANDYGFSTGVTRVYEILVREEQAEAATEVADAAAAQWAEDADLGAPGGTGGNGCRQFVLVAGIVLLVALAVGLVALSR